MREEPSNGIVVPVTAAQTICNRPCALTSLSLNPAAAACTVTLYDPLPNQTAIAGGTIRATLVAPASVSTVVHTLGPGIEFSNGCIAVVTGVGATANVGWAVL